jgi:hypothetical protein
MNLNCQIGAYRGFGIGAKGLIYARRDDNLARSEDLSNYVEPNQNIEEYQQEQNVHAVEVDNLPIVNMQGLFVAANDNEVNNVLLGVREDLWANVERRYPGQTGAEAIIDHDINERLRKRMEREIGFERMQMPYWQRKYEAGTGFLRNIFSHVRRENSDAAGVRLENMYGANRNINQMRMFLANQVATGLTPAQMALISADLVVRGIPLPPPPPPGLLARRIQQLANADDESLAGMRERFSPPAGNIFPAIPVGMMFAPRNDVVPPTPIDRLIELARVESNSRRKTLSTYLYDHRRLHQFLDGMRNTNPAIFQQITDILEENALFPIENHPEAQALIAYLQARWQLRGPTDLATELNNIRTNLPMVDEKVEEGKEPSEQLRQWQRIEEIIKNIQQRNAKLQAGYRKSATIGARMRNVNQQIANLPPIPAKGKDYPERGAFRQQLITLEEERLKLYEEIVQMEGEHRSEATELNRTLFNTPGQALTWPVPAPTDPTENLRNFFTAGPPGVPPPPPPGPPPTVLGLPDSTETQLFGDATYRDNTGVGVPPAPSPFRTFVSNNNYSDTRLRMMEREIRVGYRDFWRQRERVNPRQLLYLLKTGDLTRQGITNEEKRRQMAMLSANMSIVDAQNMQMFRSTNAEHAERLGGETLGMRWLNRTGKWLGAKLNVGGIYEARDIIDQLSGFDKDFRMFKGIPKDITLAEMRDLILRNGGLSQMKLLEFATKLKQVYEGFEMMNAEGKVELFDKDAIHMENLINLLMLVREEARSREFFAEVRGMQGNKADIILRKMRESENKARQEEKDLVGRLSDKFAEWKQLFSKNVLKDKFIEKCISARKEIKAKGMNTKQAETYLWENGLATAYNALKFGMAAKEAYDISKVAAGWSWDKLKGGANFSYDKGAGAVSSVWKKGVKPAGHHIFYRPAKFAVDKGKAAVGFAARMATAPFRIAGAFGKSIWNYGKGRSHSAPPSAAKH